MNSTLQIPPAVIPRLREATRPVMELLGDELESAANDPTTFDQLHARLAGIWALLDVIGWSEEEDTGEPLEVDAGEHAGALTASLDAIIPMLAQWLTELDDDEDKPSRENEYTRMQQFEASVRHAIANPEQEQ
jgi:hypothetical protein